MMLMFQSSLALTDRRYRGEQRVGWEAGSFNPRLPLRTGATIKSKKFKAFIPVSILACPYGQALPLYGGLFALSNTFQSSPALTDRRYMGRPASSHYRHSFNPRLPLRTGATPIRGQMALLHIVSILACPYGQALRAKVALKLTDPVSILA